MTNCIILRGLPGIGKSTWAKEQGIPIVNRDTLRLENPGVKEKEIKDMQYDLLKKYFDNGVDCILDNTHMFPGSIESAKYQCERIGFDITVKDFMEGVPILSHQRATFNNKSREARVPQCIIDKMYLANHKVSEMTHKKNVYIFDLDGTLANLEHRLHYVKNLEGKEGWKKDWQSFFSEVDKDTVIENVSRIWHSLSSLDICKIIVSGRSNECAFATEEWLRKNGFEYDFILMRDSWDKRDDTEVKRDLYDMCLKGNNILGVFDDRKRILDMWQEEGVFTFDVSQGKVF